MAKRDADADRAVVRALINTPAMHPEVLEAMREIGLRVLKRVGQRRRRSLRLRPRSGHVLWESAPSPDTCAVRRGHTQ